MFIFIFIGVVAVNVYDICGAHLIHSPALLDQRELYDEVRQLLSLNGDVGPIGSSGQQGPEASMQEFPSETDEEVVLKPDTPKAVTNWPAKALQLGQVSGVAVNSDLQPVIFHRSDRVWDEHSFNETHHYQQIHLGPIAENTVLTLDPKDGKVLGQWGANLFYMPHGLTIDRHDNLWVTDVALHQVFKFRPGELEPSLVFGKEFQPGPGLKHLCKPTHVAVATTGEIFIADGYCNNRILKFNAMGVLLRTIPSPSEFLSLQVPHALALLEGQDRLCVADRENMRVTCPRAGLYSVQGKKEPALTIQQPDMGRVFGVAAAGNLVYAVNGPTSQAISVQGFTIDPQTETVIDHWSPDVGFGNPHAIATCPNGSAIYIAEIAPNKIWKFVLHAQN